MSVKPWGMLFGVNNRRRREKGEGEGVCVIKALHTHI
jgi:hypothetical protein